MKALTGDVMLCPINKGTLTVMALTDKALLRKGGSTDMDGVHSLGIRVLNLLMF